jgi:hypothetical protein
MMSRRSVGSSTFRTYVTPASVTPIYLLTLPALRGQNARRIDAREGETNGI